MLMVWTMHTSVIMCANMFVLFSFSAQAIAPPTTVDDFLYMGLLTVWMESCIFGSFNRRVS